MSVVSGNPLTGVPMVLSGVSYKSISSRDPLHFPPWSRFTFPSNGRESLSLSHVSQRGVLPLGPQPSAPLLNHHLWDFTTEVSGTSEGRRPALCLELLSGLGPHPASHILVLHPWDTGLLSQP